MEPMPHDSRQWNARVELRRFESLLVLPWAVGTLMLSIRVIGARLFLVYLYGWGRVQQEQLRVLDMPKHAPWLVSNGDSIEKGHFVHFVISSACWLTLFFATYPLIRLLLPRRH